MTAFISKISLKKAVLFTIIFAALYVLINYSAIGVAGLLKITGGANILDFEFGYNYDEAYRILTALGAEGRAFHLTRILPLDFLLPLSYALCFAGWIALFIKHLSFRKWINYSLFVPVLAMLFDWAENIGIIAMLRSYPGFPEWAAYLSSCAGMLKTIFTTISISLIAILLIIFVIKKLRNRSHG